VEKSSRVGKGAEPIRPDLRQQGVIRHLGLWMHVRQPNIILYFYFIYCIITEVVVAANYFYQLSFHNVYHIYVYFLD
jgi:hypothetical protein